MSSSRPPQRGEVVDRLDEQEREIERLKNTLRGITHKLDGVSMSGRCCHCNRAYVIISHGEVYCPACGSRRTR